MMTGTSTRHVRPTSLQTAPPSAPYDDWARRLLGRPLVITLAVLALVQLTQWVPHYLTWPLFPDHDVFATAAQAWDAGERPYRDFHTNNFPGAIYVFWGVGKVFGWGQSTAVYALDALFLLAFGGATIAWSRKCVSDWRPGLIAYLAWLSFYLDLDYSLTAQRDWHAAGLAVMAIMLAQSVPQRWGRLGSALLLAMAATVRPQVGLFLPAWWLALGDATEKLSERKALFHRLAWTLVLAGLFILLLAPLLLQGLVGDFLERLRLVALGGEYSKTSLKSIRDELLREALKFEYWLVALPLALQTTRLEPARRHLVWVWLLAFAGVVLYKPVSPVPHAYLIQPLTIVWALLMGLLAWVVLHWRPAVPTLQLTAVALLIALQITGRPRFCNWERTWEAPGVLASGTEGEREPMGVEFSPWFKQGATYKWRDYRDLLAYLREHTSETTRVANVLRGYPAINSATGRLPAFPAESIAWCLLIRPEDEGPFAQALEAHEDSVVVWAPSEVGVRSRFDLLEMAPAIERLYQPETKFGPFEVWRRKPKDASAGPG